MKKTATKSNPKKRWRLDSAVERHEKAPDTFHIPTAQERKGLVVGDFAKLIFVRTDGPTGGVEGERMWVKVTEVTADDRYKGILQNNPAFIDGLAHSDPVEFGPEHVCMVEVP